MSLSNDSTVLVTGATGQVGWGIARAAVEAGCSVVLPVRDVEKAKPSLGPELEGGKVLVVAVDFSDERSVAAMRDAAIARFGRIDHVAAPLGGWWQKGGSIDQPSAELRDLLGVYVESPLLLMKMVAPSLRDRGGSFLLVTGAAGEGTIPGAGLLVVAVRAQYALSHVLRSETKDDSLRVNELRIACRIEREPRAGVVPSRVAGAAFLEIMQGTTRSQVLRYTGEGRELVSMPTA